MALALLLLVSTAHAQSVGLVLSGGGAKGLYHIGVIRALEESGIPIDYVSGTSMGSIVGGMYAAGYSPEQMAAEFTGDRIPQWLTGRIEHRYQYYFKEMDRDAAMLTLRFDGQRRERQTRRRGGLPDNLVSSDQLDLGFVEYFATANAASGGDFDSLFVPFRCVATDATHQRAVTYRSGDLGKAIRASMSIPMMFRPMVIDSALLYDGGLFNNFPWQPLVEEFAPDILIGSKCVEDETSLENTSMMEQAFVLTMLHTDYSLPRASDVMISRSLADVSTMDFGKAAQIIAAGYEDAMRMMPQIKQRIARRVAPAEVRARREAWRVALPELHFGSYRVEGLDGHQADYIRRLLASGRRSGERYTLEGFRTEYFKILSEGEIEGDYPEVRYDSAAGRFEMTMRMRTKPSLQLKVGGNISSTALNQAYIGLEYRTLGRAAHTHRLDGYFSPFYTSVQLATRTDLYWRLPIFAEMGGSYNYYNYFRSDYGMVSRASDLRYGKYEDFYAHAMLGTPLGRHSVMTLQGNAARGHYRYSQSTKVYERGDELDVTNFDFLGAKFEVERYNLDYPLYPTGGVHQTLSGIAIAGRERFRPGIAGARSWEVWHRTWLGAKFMREQYFRIPSIKWFSLGYRVDAVLTSHPAFSNEYASNVTMPAFTPTPHSRIVYMSEFRASSYAAAGLVPIFRIIPNLYLRASAYAFLPGGESMSEMRIDQRMRYMFDFTAAYQTLVGPVSLSLSKYDARGNNNFFVTFNFGLAIFNKKSLFY